MIELIPAIDIINGQCVRLTKGDYDQKTVYGSPLEMAQEFERIGFKRLHMVDLDGAKSKHIVNSPVLSQITTETKLTIDFGGGIKTDEDIETAFNHGAQMVTIGSVAVTEPDRFMGWLEKYGAERIILGVTSEMEKSASMVGRRILQKTSYPSSKNISTLVSARCCVQRYRKMEHWQVLPLTSIRRSWRPIRSYI